MYEAFIYHIHAQYEVLLLFSTDVSKNTILTILFYWEKWRESKLVNGFLLMEPFQKIS